MTILISIISVLLGVSLGSCVGVLIPMVLGWVTYFLTSDKSSGAGMGYAMMLTVPCLAIWGGMIGYVTAKTVVSSSLNLDYFISGKGLTTATPFYILGFTSLIFSYHLGLQKVLLLPFQIAKQSVEQKIKPKAPEESQQIATKLDSPKVSTEVQSETEDSLWHQVRESYLHKGISSKDADKYIEQYNNEIAKLKPDQRLLVLKSMLSSLKENN